MQIMNSPEESPINLESQLAKLPIFLKVVESGSLRSAAKALHMPQPSVSRAMASLESALDKRLFVRSNSGIALTEEGQLVFEFADRMKHELDDLTLKLNKGSKENFELSLGAFESIVIYFFPDLINRLTLDKADLQLSIHAARSRILMKRLRRGALDAILSVNPEEHSDVYSVRLFADEYRLYSSTRHPERADAPMISMFAATDSKGHSLREWVANGNFSSRRQFDCASFEAAKTLVKAGLGLGILPKRVADEACLQGDLVEYLDPKVKKSTAWRFGEHFVSLSYLNHRRGDPKLAWLERQLQM
ncbi:MAG: LysR family transcriptional regulator [Proteobacteria bacterium]|nr:MAG: LysR family transcriptional regulator [Pseudomonadota bacterium]